MKQSDNSRSMLLIQPFARAETCVHLLLKTLSKKSGKYGRHARRCRIRCSVRGSEPQAHVWQTKQFKDVEIAAICNAYGKAASTQTHELATPNTIRRAISEDILLYMAEVLCALPHIRITAAAAILNAFAQVSALILGGQMSSIMKLSS
jgi:hypothetical protein